MVKDNKGKDALITGADTVNGINRLGIVARVFPSKVFSKGTGGRVLIKKRRKYL